MKGTRSVWIFPLPLCALKLNKLRMAAQVKRLQEAFVPLEKPGFSWIAEAGRNEGERCRVVGAYQSDSRAVRLGVFTYQFKKKNREHNVSYQKSG